MVTTGSKSTQGEIARLLKEAELYEAQGLYSAAQEVYRNILAKEPGNRKAREKLTQFRESQVTRTAPDKPPRVPEDLSPRIAFDLGLAYM